MAFDYAQFDASRKARRVSGIRQHEQTLRRFSMAEVPMQQLTADAHWNQYLQVLQARLEEDKAEIAGLTDQLTSSALADPIVLMAIKLKLAEAKGRLEAREHAASLPSLITTEAKEAKSLLSELP